MATQVIKYFFTTRVQAASLAEGIALFKRQRNRGEVDMEGSEVETAAFQVRSAGRRTIRKVLLAAMKEGGQPVSAEIMVEAIAADPVFEGFDTAAITGKVKDALRKLRTRGVLLRRNHTKDFFICKDGMAAADAIIGG